MDIAGQDAELPEIRHRTRYLSAIVALVFLGLAIRLFYLQIVEGDNYYRLTADSIVRTVVLPAVRGQIRDHKGRVLATMVPSYDVQVQPSQLTHEAYLHLREILGPDVEGVPSWDAIREEAQNGKDRSLVVAEDIKRDTMAQLETAMDKPGIRVAEVQRRHYPFVTLASHAIGYMNEVSADELRTRKDEGYQAGDYVGRTGVERQWEPYLRGQKGFERVVLNRRGLRRTDVRIADLIDGPLKQMPVPGNNVVLSLDMDLQRIVERAMRGSRAAAAVFLDVETGRILAIASKPSFDPNLMSRGPSPEALARIMTDRLRPFRDKALADTYNPGSTFKVVTAATALEEKLITPEDKVRCGGYIQVGRRRFRCTKVHKTVNLHEALVQSCNVFFYTLGGQPGMMDRMAKFANELGLGAPSGLGLNNEQAGFVPTEEWHRSDASTSGKNEGFVVGHALNTAIGEGATRATVLQMALVYATIANGGKLWLPQIVERVESPDGKVVEEFPPRVRRDIAVSAETLAIIRSGLYGVVFDPKGTAYKARSHKIEVAGKTGTAQVYRGGRTGKDDPPLPYERVDHAWFAGYAPAAKPRIAFAVLVEHGGHGGAVAAPVAMEIVDNYFEAVLPPEDRTPPRLARRPPRVASGDSSASLPGRSSDTLTVPGRTAKREGPPPSLPSSPANPVDEESN